MSTTIDREYDNKHPLRVALERYRKENGNSLYETLVDIDTNGDYIEGIRLYINMFGDKDFFPAKKN